MITPDELHKAALALAKLKAHGDKQLERLYKADVIENDLLTPPVKRVRPSGDPNRSAFENLSGNYRDQ